MTCESERAPGLQANVLPGESSVTVLSSRCVPNCFAVVENTLPIATGPGSFRHLEAVARPFGMSREIGDIVEHLAGRRVDRDPILVAPH